MDHIDPSWSGDRGSTTTGRMVMGFFSFPLLNNSVDTSLKTCHLLLWEDSVVTLVDPPESLDLNLLHLPQTPPIKVCRCNRAFYNLCNKLQRRLEARGRCIQFRSCCEPQGQLQQNKSTAVLNPLKSGKFL